jgi:hypothetical protein
MWKICQAFRARYRSFVSDSTRLPRQTTPTKLAVFSFNLGILKTEGKNKSSSSITTVESKATSERPFLLLERPMIRETLPPKSRVAPPTGQSRRCAQVACAPAPLTSYSPSHSRLTHSRVPMNHSHARTYHSHTPLTHSRSRAICLRSNQIAPSRAPLRHSRVRMSQRRSSPKYHGLRKLEQVTRVSPPANQ